MDLPSDDVGVWRVGVLGGAFLGVEVKRVSDTLRRVVFEDDDPVGEPLYNFDDAGLCVVEGAARLGWRVREVVPPGERSRAEFRDARDAAVRRLTRLADQMDGVGETSTSPDPAPAPAPADD